MLDDAELFDLLSEWGRLVKRLEFGYPYVFGVDDYFQNISVRNRIHRRLSEGAVLSGAEAGELNRCDDEFRNLTVPSKATFLDGSHWWHWRLPKLSSEEFEKEARELELI